jgi:predicted TIM-barrel fold metal-dependent hydrolase
MVSYRRAIAELAEHLGCAATEAAVLDRRLTSPPDEYASSLLRATGTEWLLLDDGFPPPDIAHGRERMAELAGCPSLPVLRIERVAEEALTTTRELGEVRERVRAEAAGARASGYAAIKTIAAYRTGLDVRLPSVEEAQSALDIGARMNTKPVVDLLLWEALEANAPDPLPVQVHTGFGDSDLLLPAADPAHLKAVIEAFPDTPFVLLHAYPYVREAGWLAHVYANVFFDLSLTIPHVARPAEAVREALELAPVSKLLYASDAARAPELYFLAARHWRETLATVLPELLPAGEVEDAVRAILRTNALELYRLGDG